MAGHFTYPEKAPLRDIILLDMDAFFASVEQRDYPEYRGIPIAVGGSSRRGVVAAASYEAREYGVRSAMPSAQAIKLCPQLIFAPGRYEVYKAASVKVMAVLRSYSETFQPLSIDEAFLDVTDYCRKNKTSPKSVAQQIKERIYEETELPSSAGISFNKFLAKVASGYDKPNGLFEISRNEADDFVAKLPIRKVPGVGKVTEEKLKAANIHNCNDVLNYSENDLRTLLGKFGKYLYHLLRWEYDSPVEITRIRKSLGKERTFEKNLSDFKQMELILDALSEKISVELKKKMLTGKTVTLKIKHFDFEVTTRSFTGINYGNEHSFIFPIAKRLLTYPIPPQKEVRLLGISISNLAGINGKAGEQMSIF
ncbi:MAG: DNA polymerase IV [Candidatus Kapaibacteriales bacterium]